MRGLRAGAVGVGIALALTACGGGKVALKSDPVPVGDPPGVVPWHPSSAPPASSSLQADQACQQRAHASGFATAMVVNSHQGDGGTWIVDGGWARPDGTIAMYVCTYADGVVDFAATP
jgi:hypothetical protein